MCLARGKPGCRGSGWPIRSSTRACCTWRIATRRCCWRRIRIWRASGDVRCACCCGYLRSGRPWGHWQRDDASSEVDFRQCRNSTAGRAAGRLLRDSYNREARGTQLVCQYILIDLTRNPAPSVSNTVNAQPITCPDTSFSLSPSACSACIYCLSAFKACLVRRCRHMVAEVLTDPIAEPAAAPRPP